MNADGIGYSEALDGRRALLVHPLTTLHFECLWGREGDFMNRRIWSAVFVLGITSLFILRGAVAQTSSPAASAQNLKRIPLPATQNPSNRDLPIAGAVWAGDTLYVSGWLDPDLKTHTNTTSQTVGILKDLEKFLASQKLTLGDVVMMHIYLGADPAKEGKGDYAGMMAGYSQFFGTGDQPNKPARTTLQVVLPAGAIGALVEIDLIAVRPK